MKEQKGSKKTPPPSLKGRSLNNSEMESESFSSSQMFLMSPRESTAALQRSQRINSLGREPEVKKLLFEGTIPYYQQGFFKSAFFSWATPLVDVRVSYLNSNYSCSLQGVVNLTLTYSGSFVVTTR